MIERLWWWCCCSVYVIDLGSVHGTFVANERLTKDSPVELEAGQSLRFAASTRTYVLRKTVTDPSKAPAVVPEKFVYPPAPDVSDTEAVVAYNTSLNRLGVPSPNPVPKFTYQRYASWFACNKTYNLWTLCINTWVFKYSLHNMYYSRATFALPTAESQTWGCAGTK